MHSYIGTRHDCSGRTSTPLSSSSSGTPVKRLASPVLIDVSVGVVASEKLDSEGAWVDVVDWWTQAGAMEEPALRAERGSDHGGFEAGAGAGAGAGPGPSKAEERWTKRVVMSSLDDCSHSRSGLCVIESSRMPSSDRLAGCSHSGCRCDTVAQASVSLRLICRWPSCSALQCGAVQPYCTTGKAAMAGESERRYSLLGIAMSSPGGLRPVGVMVRASL